MLTWVQCMQSLLKVMNRALQGLWIARLARDPLLVSGLLLPVWCVGARTRFLMTRCTIPTFVNVFAGNLFIRLLFSSAKCMWLNCLCSCSVVSSYVSKSFECQLRSRAIPLQLVTQEGHHTMVSNLSMLVHNALDIDIQSKMSSSQSRDII